MDTNFGTNSCDNLDDEFATSTKTILSSSNPSKETFYDGNGHQYDRSLKRIEKLQYMNNLDIKFFVRLHGDKTCIIL